MGSEYEFDKTRDAIGTHGMDDNERRNMLNKFKDAGGQVLREGSVRQDEGKKSSGGEIARRSGTLPSERERERRRAEETRKRRTEEDLKSAKKKHGGFLTTFFLSIRAALAGVVPFGSREVSPRFMSLIAIDLKQAMVELNLLGNDLFLQNPATGKKIVRALDKANPLLMETLEYAHKIYNQELFNNLLDSYQANPAHPVGFSRVDKHVKALYKQLYILYPFQETLKKGFQIASEIYLNNTTDEAATVSFEQKKKKLQKDLRTIFQTVFPKLYLLIARMDGVEYPPFSLLLEKELDIHPEDKLGQRRKGEETSFDSAYSNVTEDEIVDDEFFDAVDSEDAEGGEEEGKEDKQEDEDNPILQTKEYQYGKKVMDALPPPKLIEKYNLDKLVGSLKLNDKVLLSYLFFQEFDQEYSFVLTTNKIKLNVDYGSGVKTDYKKTLADLYDESREIIRSFEKYREAFDELTKLKKNKMSSNYVEQSKLETKAEGRLDIEARNTRAMIRVFMDKVTQNLGKLIADMKGDKVLVANMDEPIQFDAAFETKKRLHGKPVQTCILEAYSFALALRERLSSGDLFGGVIQLSPEEMVQSFGDTFGTEAAKS